MYINANELEPKFPNYSVLKNLKQKYFNLKSHRFFVNRHFYVLTKCSLVYANVSFIKWL